MKFIKTRELFRSRKISAHKFETTIAEIKVQNIVKHTKTLT